MTLRQPGNRNRARIRAVVAAKPGLSFRAISRATGIASGTARHHLSVLQRRREIVEERVGRRLLAYYPAGLDESKRLKARIQRDAALAQVYETVRRLGQPCQSMILDAVEQPRSTTQHRLGRLVAMGAVSVRHGVRRSFYEVKRRDVVRWMGVPI